MSNAKIQCKATVYVREHLRYTGRTKSGFERNYEKRQCSRMAKHEGYCYQHSYKASV